MEIPIVRGGIHDDVGICLRTAIHDSSRLRVQWITHYATNCRTWIQIDIGDVLAPRKADQFINRRLARTAAQAEIRQRKRTGIRRRNCVGCSRQISICCIVRIQISCRRIRKVLDSTTKAHLVAIRKT